MTDGRDGGFRDRKRIKMATIYRASDASIITDGLQGSNVCDEAIQAAQALAAADDEDVILEDDDGYWLISPDGRGSEVTPSEAKSWGFEPHASGRH